MAVVMAAMAAFQLAGSYFAAQNARDTAELNNDVAQWNAEFAELDAHDAIIEGESAVARYQAVVDQTLGQQQVAFAVADVDATYGSASEISKETRFLADMNRMEIEKQAQEKALGYKRQARDFRLQAGINLAAEEARAGAIQAQGITSALSTGASGYGQYKSEQLQRDQIARSGNGGGGSRNSNSADGWGITSNAPNSTSGYQFSTGEF